MSVPQYTTPTVTLTFTEQGLDLTSADSVYVTLASRGYKITKTGEELTIGEKTIAFSLSQEETSNMAMGDVRVQANWMNGNVRTASNVVAFQVSDQLLRQVVEP